MRGIFHATTSTTHQLHSVAFLFKKELQALYMKVAFLLYLKIIFIDFLTASCSKSCNIKEQLYSVASSCLYAVTR